IVGSDTMAKLVESWTEAFTAENPGTLFSLSMHGSNEVPKALAAREVWIGAMSREMKAEERAMVRDAVGQYPIRLVVAIDGLAVIVNPYNAVPALTIHELDAIFSETRACGSPIAFTHWS